MTTERAVTGNAADEDQVASAEVRQRYTARMAENDLKSVMETAHGRRFVWSLLGGCALYHEGWSESHAEMARIAGIRSVGLRLLKRIELVCPDLYDLMQKEARQRTTE